MRIFFYSLRAVFILSVLLLSLTAKVYAQDIQEADSTKAKVSSSGISGKYMSFRRAYKHNPEYLKSEANMLRVRLLNTVQVPYFSIHPKDDIEKKLVFSSNPLMYVGADIGWNIFTFGYSIGLDRYNSNKRFSLGTYTRFFAINAEILWLNNLMISDVDDFMPEDDDTFPINITLDGAYFRSRSIQSKFFPNGKKMAFGNTINPVFRQLKSAGTMVLALSYADYDFNTNLSSIDREKYEWISEIGLSNLNLSKYELGAGYSYNFVVGSKWVLFISDVIGISTKHHNYKMLSDVSPTAKTNLGWCNYFRTGACYYNKSYFIGTNISYEIDALSTNHVLFNKANLNTVIYLGYKFNVSKFNSFVSDFLNVNIN